MVLPNIPLTAFNRGLVSKLGLARTDIKRLALSAETQTNWMPRVLGSMMLRPGLAYTGGTADDNIAYHLPFVYASDDTAIIEFTDEVLRIKVDETPVTRPSVSTAVTSGDFSSATGWTDADEGSAVSAISGGQLSLVGTDFAAAIRYQDVTVAPGDLNVQHALRITVLTGSVTFQVGFSGSSDDGYITRTTLGTGVHSLAFTPSSDFRITVENTTQYAALVDSIEIEAAGIMEIPSPYVEDDLKYIRFDQSADVVYLACKGYQQRKIERRGTYSWSLVLYQPNDGPFRNINITNIRLTPSALSGDITLTASRNLFRTSNVGGLYKLDSSGQQVQATLTGEDQFTSDIRVTGVGASQRQFTITITGTWSATITLQRSVGETGNWVDVTTYTGNTSTTYNDSLDNQIIYYRIGIKTSQYTSGSAAVTLSYSSGTLSGIVRVTAYNSATSVNAQVLVPLGGTASTDNWYEGEWSPRRGYPSAVVLAQGRLWWAGKSRIYGSVSDGFESFDSDTEGDSGPINRSIGSGPVDNVNWLVRMKRLLIGTEGAEWTAQSSSLDEPLTPSNFALDDPSTQGSAEVAPVKIDSRTLFVQKSRTKLYQISNMGDSAYGEYASAPLMELAPEVGQPGIKRLAVQRQPDTRVHCVRDDGKVAVLISQPAEDVMCWVLVETDGVVEDVIVLPGTEEDKVYYCVARTINGSTKRFLERWALESQCVGGSLNHQADAYITYSGSSTTTIPVAHLPGESVVVWGNGKDLGTYTVSGGGSITVSEAVTSAIIGLTYTAQFKSAKLAFAAQQGTALAQNKKISYIGLILANTHYQGLRYGPDFDTLDDLPLVEGGADTAADTVWESFDSDRISFNGEWSTDSRICIEASAPRPATVLAAIIGMKTNG